MEGKKEVVIFFLLLLALGVFLAITQLSLYGNLTGFIVFEQSNGSSFSNGAYINTIHNGSAIVLSGNNLTGNHTGAIIDAGQLSVWNNISFVKTSPETNDLVSVDGSGAVFLSNNRGASWSTQNFSYGGGTATDDMAVNSSNGIFILFNQDIYFSSDKGVNWILLNDDFNPSDGNDGLLIGVDNSDYVYAIDGSGDVWRSNNSGSSFSNVGDFNGGTSNNAKGIAINSSDSIFIVDGSGAVFLSNNRGASWSTQNSSYGGGTATDDMSVDIAGNLYILLNRDVYKSSNQGVSWTIVNNTFSNDQDGLTMTSDRNDSIYIVDPSGDVYRSDNSGSSFSNVGDFNGGATNDIKGLDDLLTRSNVTFQVRNCSSADCTGVNFRGPDGTASSYYSALTSNFSLQGRYFQYVIYFSRGDTSLAPYVKSVAIDYSFLATEPTVDITFPTEGSVFGKNESLALNFTISNSTGLDKCWYSINQGTNLTINCVNTFFNVSGNGNYVLTLYANESVAGLSVMDNVNFSVQIGAPTIFLTSPNNGAFLSGLNVSFVYSASDIDLDSCELWGDFTGQFKRNQTNLDVVSGAQSNFSLGLKDGLYIWNIFCNDTIGNGAFNGNRTFTIDSAAPSLALTAPSGVYKSLSNIPLTFSYNDSNSVACNYNVSFETSKVIVIGNTELSGCNSTTFGVDTDSSYGLWLRINDSAGNVNYTNNSFTVDTSTTPESSGDGGSGGGGGGSSSSILSGLTGLAKLELDIASLDSLTMKPGESRILSVEVVNSGTRFLNECKLNVEGDMQEWVSSRQVESLSSGEKLEFLFNLNLPQNLESREYVSNVVIVCNEVESVKEFRVNVLNSDFSILIKSYERIGDILRVDYLVEDFSGESREVEIAYSLRDVSGEVITSGSESVFVEGGSIKDFVLDIELPKGIEGDFDLIFGSSEDNLEARQRVRLATTGFAIAGLSESNKKSLLVLGSVVAGLALLYFVVKFLRRHHSKTNFKKEKRFIKIDLTDEKDKLK